MLWQKGAVVRSGDNCSTRMVNPLFISDIVRGKSVVGRTSRVLPLLPALKESVSKTGVSLRDLTGPSTFRGAEAQD